jgi:hypothetical protein
MVRNSGQTQGQTRRKYRIEAVSLWGSSSAEGKRLKDERLFYIAFFDSAEIAVVDKVTWSTALTVSL